MRFPCLSLASACSPVSPLQASLLGLGLTCISFACQQLNLVSWLCGGPGPEPKGGRGRTVPNLRVSCGAVTIFSKLKISQSQFTM